MEDESFFEDIDWDNIQVLEMEEDNLPLDFYISESTFDVEQQEEKLLALAPVPFLFLLSVGAATLACVVVKSYQDREDLILQSGAMQGATVGGMTWLPVNLLITAWGATFPRGAVAALVKSSSAAFPLFMAAPVSAGLIAGVLCDNHLSEGGEGQERPLSQP